MEIKMRNFNLKKLAAVSALGLVAILGTSSLANAQGGWRNDRKQERKLDKQQDKIQKQRAKLEAQRVRLEQQRQAQWNRGNNSNVNRNRYRVYRNGRYYNTDNRGAELLRQAVNRGYQEGFRAGQADRNNRRGGSWNNSNVYRNGNSGYQSYVDASQYQHYFQQGFQRGYQDGYNSRNEYGSNNNGSLNILGTILNQVLNIQQY